MVLSVRLKSDLGAALERYCTERGATKSLVMQEALARYLVEAREAGPARGEAMPNPPSRAYLAFERAGLIGRGALDRDPDWADAELIWLAEASGIHRIATLDAADFGVYRIVGRKPFDIVWP